jgi:hypothetical protein
VLVVVAVVRIALACICGAGLNIARRRLATTAMSGSLVGPTTAMMSWLSDRRECVVVRGCAAFCAKGIIAQVLGRGLANVFQSSQTIADAFAPSLDSQGGNHLIGGRGLFDLLDPSARAWACKYCPRLCLSHAP